MKRWFRAGAGWVVMWVLAGCAGDAPVAVEPRDETETLRERLEHLYESDRPHEAIPLLETALTNSVFAQSRPEHFRKILELHLAEGEIKAAQGRYFAALQEPDLMETGFGLIEGRLMESAQYGALAAWSESLRRAGLPESKQETLVGWQLDAYRLADAPDKMIALIAELIRDFERRAAERLLRRHLDRVLADRKQGELDRLLVAIEALGQDTAWLETLVRVYRLKDYVAQRRLNEAIELFRGSVDLLSKAGHDGIRVLRSIVRLARETGELARADTLCEAVVDRADADSALRREAAAQTVRLARERALRPRRIYKRLVRAIEADGPTGAHLNLTREVLYDIMQRGNRWDRRRMLALCETLLQKAERDHERGDAIGLALDACFLTERFDRALELVTDGIPGMTEESLAILTAKVKAHQAMADKRREEAIGHFREFMDRIKAADRWESEGVDPFTGLKVSREEVLALNAERIAGLWRDLRKPDRADQALEEARQYMRAALERLPEDTEEYRAARKKLDALAQQ